MRTTRRAAALFVLMLCVSPRGVLADVEPFSAPPDRAALVEAEERAWAAGDDFDRNIRRARNLYRDEALQTYLQSLIDRLYPEFRGAIVSKGIVRDAVPSAFVLPNGSVYVTLGLIGRLSSEAQLATVLGHEAAHWVHRHGYQQMQSAKSLSALGLGLGVISGLGPLGSVLTVGVLYGYSRDHERDADRIGFERVVRAGFAPKAGVEAFELLWRKPNSTT
jgi:predicted Zn-dependent protease